VHAAVVPEPLRSHVVAVFEYEVTGTSPRHLRVLPAGALELVVPVDGTTLAWRNRDGRAAESRVPVVSGPRRSAFDLGCSPGHRVLGVSFRPGGAWPLFGAPMDELLDAHVTLEELFGRPARRLAEAVAGASSVDDRVAAVVQFLRERQRRASSRPHPAVSRLLASDARAVADVVAAAGLSHRRFIELFRREVGLTPRDFLRVKRLQRAVAGLRANERGDAALAHELGYADQSHFILECRKLTGLTPRALAEASASAGAPMRPKGQLLPIRPV
jgi:AraC-like DNA-binding protein